MAQNPKDGRLLYHLTSFENLESIIQNGLMPRKFINEFKDIADHEILQSREKYELELYTPFHFFSGSPFAGRVQLMNLDGEFIYITIKRDLAESNNFQIIPSHPLNYMGEPLSWKEGMESIDWELMAVRNYSNQQCKEVCMAECIFKGSVPINCFHCIYVKTEEVKIKVESVIRNYTSSRIFVNVVPGMFVNHD